MTTNGECRRELSIETTACYFDSMRIMKWRYFNPIFAYQESLKDEISAWSGHRYFAYDFIRNIQPNTIVELGTHHGTSFFSMCQSLKDGEYVPGEMVAVDTWLGDKHAGFYDESVYNKFLEIKDTYYHDLPIKPIRKTFDETVNLFEDASIDLLHIDGLHTYEAVKHDFESWISKVKSDGVVILHDIKVNEDDFGVYKLWEELKEQYVTIEFFQSFGLGVLFLDENIGRKFKEQEKEWQIHYSYVYEMNSLVRKQVEDQQLKHTADENFHVISGLKQELQNEQNDKTSLLSRVTEFEKKIAITQAEQGILTKQIENQRKEFFEQYSVIQNELIKQNGILNQKDILLGQKKEENKKLKNGYDSVIKIKNFEISRYDEVIHEKDVEISRQDEVSREKDKQKKDLETYVMSLNKNISNYQHQVSVMQASKFWKIRGLYLRVKWAMTNPYGFVLKYVRKITNRSSREEKVTFYISSKGNYFFKEILAIIQEGFIELGYNCSVKDEHAKFAVGSGLHIVIAPHEFFFLGNGKKIKDQSWSENVIIINFEQPSLQWFKLVEDCLGKAHAVWDINYESYKILSKKHKRVRFLPLGYVKSIEKNNLVLNLPENQCTESLDLKSMEGNFREKDLSERPIDICFIGALSDRRSSFFTKYASLFSKYNCYWYFWDRKMPIIPGINSPMDTETAQGIIQRSKILINIHQGEEPYFEWHRIVNQGIANRVLVVSEKNISSGKFSENSDLVYADLGQFSETVDYYLDSKNEEKAQNIATEAYRKFKSEYVLSTIIKRALNDI